MSKGFVSDNPKLLSEWHPTKNGGLMPDDVTAFSNRKVWWLCEKGHEWEASVDKRSNGRGCPYCSSKRVCDDNCLQTLNPEVSKEWHLTKNGDLSPNDVTASSHRKVWWRCENEHEWEAIIASRTRGRGCPECAVQKQANAFRKNRIKEKGSLLDNNPELAKQWHPIKNGVLTPNDITNGSEMNVWWQCEKGHEWKAIIYSRTQGSGCPICSQELKTSFPEQAIYFYFKTLFSDTLNRFKYADKWEIDIFIPSLNFGIEYDGFYYHKGKESLGHKKETHLVSKGIHLLRIKETDKELKHCYQEKTSIYCSKGLAGIQLDEVINACFNYVSQNITQHLYSIDIDVIKDRIKIYELYIKGEKEKSLLAIYPELTNEWHPTRNGKLTPDMLPYGSKKKAWWQCVKGHEWESAIYNRASGNGCPYCSGKLVCADNCLKTLNPELAQQWHLTKNSDLTPNDVTTGSGKKVWWQCENGHEWKAVIADRANGRGCPFCSGKRVCDDNCLQTLSPDLSKQWHPTKNGDLTSNDVTISSGKRVWWQCEKGHEWQAAIYSRNNGSGCPECGKLKQINTQKKNRIKEKGSLLDNNPELSKQWHPSKNGDLTPNDVTSGSNENVWWLCEKGHEWKAVIYSRKDGNGCPYCSGQRVCADNSLKTLSPELSKQWHLTKNGDLTPNNVTTGSNKKVWWQCEKGHEWDAIIASRSSGNGCPYCAGRRVWKG